MSQKYDHDDLEMDQSGERESKREVRVRHWAEFRTSFFFNKNRPFDLLENIFLY